MKQCLKTQLHIQFLSNLALTLFFHWFLFLLITHCCIFLFLAHCCHYFCSHSAAVFFMRLHSMSSSLDVEKRPTEVNKDPVPEKPYPKLLDGIRCNGVVEYGVYVLECIAGGVNRFDRESYSIMEFLGSQYSHLVQDFWKLRYLMCSIVRKSQGIVVHYWQQNSTRE